MPSLLGRSSGGKHFSINIKGILSILFVALFLTWTASAEADIVVGPFTFDDLAFADDATQLEAGFILKLGSAADLDDALTGFSPTKGITNIGFSPPGLSFANLFQLDFIDLRAVNGPGADIIFFDARFSADPYEIAVRELGGSSFSSFVSFAADDFINTGMAGPTVPSTPDPTDSVLYGLPIDLDVFGLPSGAIVDAIQFRSVLNADGQTEGDPVMAGVLKSQAAPVPEPAIIDLHPDVFEVAVVDREPMEPEGVFLTAFIEPPEGASTEEIHVSTVTLSVNGTPLAMAEDALVVNNVLKVLFRLDLANVSAILGVPVVKLEKVDEKHNVIEVKATDAPAKPIELIELTVSGDLMSGNFSGTDAVRVMLGIPKDTTPPTIERVRASRNILWPPNHKMVPVTVDASVSDDSDGALTCRIIVVSSNEPVNGVGDGNTAPDWEITGDLTVNLRAERSGKGSGRVYTITVQCSDASGNNAMETVTVTVPRHKWKFKDIIEWMKHHKRK